MTMIDRESAQKVIAVLDDIQRDGNDDGARAMMVLSALEEVLTQGLAGNNLPEDAGPLGEGAALRDKFVRFFGITIQVAKPRPIPYTAEEVVALAGFSEQEYLDKITNAKVGDLCIPNEEELLDSQRFWKSIADDYAELKALAQRGHMRKLMQKYGRMDTSDRENFGWGAEGWDEGRWEMTRRKYS